MLQVAIRADASLVIGKGHIMRCLTLAHEIKRNQPLTNITFFTSSEPGNLDKLIQSQGFNHISLPRSLVDCPSNNSKLWLGRTSEADADICQKKTHQVFDLLIVDHYGIDHVWEKIMRNVCNKIMVIDDLANRQHDCDILLDQTLFRKTCDYSELTPKNCLILAGEFYVLLREEFALSRNKAKIKRAELKYLPDPFNVLISIGGFDSDNISQIAIDALKIMHDEQVEFTVTVVFSSQSIYLTGIKNASKELPWLTIEEDCDAMSSLMVSADVAIGASGTTAWERCCLGLPTLSIETADNQKLVSASLTEQGAIINLGLSKHLSKNDIITALKNLLKVNRKESMTETTYKSLVKNSFSCTDGQGIKRVFQQVMDVIKSTNSMTLQLADKNDVDIIFQWQSNADIRRFSRNSTPIEYQEHCQWFEQAIKSKNRKIYLMSYQQRFVGMLRLDDIDSNSCEISILVAPKEQGKGLALKALNSLTALNIKQEIHAYVHTDNLTSHKLFQKAKFSKIDPNNYCLYPNKSR